VVGRQILNLITGVRFPVRLPTHHPDARMERVPVS
jgi:hypothetical protein